MIKNATICIRLPKKEKERLEYQRKVFNNPTYKMTKDEAINASTYFIDKYLDISEEEKRNIINNLSNDSSFGRDFLYKISTEKKHSMDKIDKLLFKNLAYNFGI